MAKKFVICEVNETYLKNVKAQMKKQKLPLPKDDSYLTVAHKPIKTINSKDLENCSCNVCKQLRS